MTPRPERVVALRHKPPAPVALRIARLRQRIASERVRTQVVAFALEPRLLRIERFIAQLRGLPAYARRMAPYALPVAGLVFRRNRVVKFALRVWGAVRLAKSVARAVVSHRRSRSVAVYVSDGAKGEFP